MRKSQKRYPFQNLILHNFEFFFSTMDINFFLKGGGQEGGSGVGYFFFTYYSLLIFFLHIHQCNDKNIIYQQFYCCLRYIFYI